MATTDRIKLVGKDLFYSNGVKLGEILCKEDGFYDFWPELHGGCWASYVLRDIANLLDEINDPYEKEIEKYFALQDSQDKEGTSS